ncbi:glycosyltransferase family A protein [Ottowia thiooxydans]|uniref:glycosyltransferase family A protein n=1 Tax=Ottowia thiooxydans TaxID=219182 RepID=UPI00048FC893|nr:glycosyltransferase family A protein [Ottowia thiooxydans]
MLISCLTITQPGRLHLLRESVGDFARQTYQAKELIILHDGDLAFDQEVREIAAQQSRPDSISVHAVSPMPLGALRNAAGAFARGDLICQWDDDDRFHPQRLQVQQEALCRESADFCFLSDQLHLYRDSGDLFWDDWHAQPYPLNFIQGTLMGRREKMPVYPDLVRGEDTGACLDILRSGHKICRLRDHGWCYVYVHHGSNAWPDTHHRAISQGNALSAARLMARLGGVRERLAEYAPPVQALALKDRSGSMAFPIR